MTSQTLTPAALEVIEKYLHLPFPGKDVNCPYYNNRRSGMRFGLRVMIGKGLPEEIVDEAKLFGLREKIQVPNLDNTLLKKYLVDHRLGVDCSGLIYHILNEESIARKLGSLRKRIVAYPNSLAKGFVGKLIRGFRSIENTGAMAFAHEKNSHEVKMMDAVAGDYLVLLSVGKERSYDHIILFHQTDRDDLGKLLRIHYTHSYRWPSDGLYDHGVRQGTIYITDETRPLSGQRWIETGKTEEDNFTVEKAQNARFASIRRLSWF